MWDALRFAEVTWCEPVSKNSTFVPPKASLHTGCVTERDACQLFELQEFKSLKTKQSVNGIMILMGWERDGGGRFRPFHLFVVVPQISAVERFKREDCGQPYLALSSSSLSALTGTNGDAGDKVEHTTVTYLSTWQIEILKHPIPSHGDVSMQTWCDRIVMHPECLVTCQRRLVPHLPQKKPRLPFQRRKKEVMCDRDVDTRGLPLHSYRPRILYQERP